MTTMHVRIIFLAAILAGFLATQAVLAQGAASNPDLSGSWVGINNEDLSDRVAGPYAADFTGLALNEEGKALALSISLSRYATVERQCALYPHHYILLAPFGIKISSETDPYTGLTLGYHIGAWGDRAPSAIWLDGRPRPLANARHKQAGFEAGQWRGNTLTTRTTHLKSGILRRNGAEQSDQTTLTTHYIRHGDLLTVVTFIEDPVYLSEPQPISKNFRLDPGTTLMSVGMPCVTTLEGQPDEGVSHYLPGENPTIDDMQKTFGIPREASLGGAETMYPEFRKKIKDKYVRPEKCLSECAGLPGRLTELPPI